MASNYRFAFRALGAPASYTKSLSIRRTCTERTPSYSEWKEEEDPYDKKAPPPLPSSRGWSQPEAKECVGEGRWGNEVASLLSRRVEGEKTGGGEIERDVGGLGQCEPGFGEEPEQDKQ